MTRIREGEAQLRKIAQRLHKRHRLPLLPLQGYELTEEETIGPDGETP